MLTSYHVPHPQEKCHQYWPAERSARYQYFVVDPMAEYNMPQYILREFKVTDARVSAAAGSPAQPASYASVVPRPVRSMQQLLEELESKVLPCAAGRRGCSPPPAAPLARSSLLASCGSPGEQLRDPYQHQTLPCLCCILGQAFNTGSPAPGVSVCTI